RGRVQSTWGGPHRQAPPVAEYTQSTTRTIHELRDGKPFTSTVEDSTPIALPLEASTVDVDLRLEPRLKGMLWFSTYKVAFAGEYAFRNNSGQERPIRFRLMFPVANAAYDDLSFTLDGRPLELNVENTCVWATATLAPGQTARLRTGYRSQGLDTWRYSLGNG